MVRISNSDECNCDTCTGGSKPSPRQIMGEQIFGGWKCVCGCHYMTGEEREHFIHVKKDIKKWKGLT